MSRLELNLINKLFIALLLKQTWSESKLQLSSQMIISQRKKEWLMGCHINTSNSIKRGDCQVRHRKQLFGLMRFFYILTGTKIKQQASYCQIGLSFAIISSLHSIIIRCIVDQCFNIKKIYKYKYNKNMSFDMVLE